jgi:hypothetical protein
VRARGPLSLSRRFRAVDVVSVPNANYGQITGVRHLRIFGGETISLAQRVENPWVRVSEQSSLLFLVF